MAKAKEEVRQLLDELPDDVEYAEIARVVSLRARLLHSREQALRGELTDNDEVLSGLCVRSA